MGKELTPYQKALKQIRNYQILIYIWVALITISILASFIFAFIFIFNFNLLYLKLTLGSALTFSVLKIFGRMLITYITKK